MNAALPALCAAAATVLLVSPNPARRLEHLSVAPHQQHVWGRSTVTALAVLGCCVVALALFGLSDGLLVDAGVVAAGVVLHLLLARRDEKQRSQRRQDVSRAARVLSGQLRIGQVPTTALQSAASDCPPLERAAATLAIGGDAAVALRDVARQPGHEGLATLAMAWELSERSGAPIASLSRQVSDGLRAQDETRTQVDAELSGPRASGRLLAALPLLGLGMGRLAGGDPFHFLAGTLPGHACVLGGVLLACAGVLWTEHLAVSVQK